MPGLQMFIFSLIAVFYIALIVMQLGDTRGELRIFRVIFPPRRQRTVPWGIAAILLAIPVVIWCSVMASWAVNAIFPEKMAFLNESTVTQPEIAILAPGEEPVVDHVASDERLINPFSQEELSEQHQLTILMQKAGRYPIIIIVCFLMAVVVAPLSEEFLFRVLLQGGIEATLRREYGLSAWCKRIPILVTALIFAAIHIRAPQETIDGHYIDLLFKGFVANIAGSLAAIFILVILLRKLYRIRWSDIGLWDFKRLPRDAAGALLLLLVILLPILIVNYSVTTLAKQLDIPGSVTDPVPLFLLAMVLGTLYFRTRRFVTVFFLHAFFNLFSFLMMLYLAFFAE